MLVPLLVAATITVAATTTDLRELVAAVGGDRVRVESLTDPRQDPHTREIHPRQLALLGRSDLLVRVGLDHEPWLARAAKSVPPPAHDVDCSRAVALLGTDTPRLRADRGTHVHAFGNPHYWLDPENAHGITAAIADALARIAPADRAVFDENRRRFLARLDAALERWRARLAPHAGARVVAVHDTWPYFARRFGLVVAEPGAPASLVRRIADGAGARVVTLAPSVGADPEAGDYLALFETNVTRLAAALDSLR